MVKVLSFDAIPATLTFPKSVSSVVIGVAAPLVIELPLPVMSISGRGVVSVRAKSSNAISLSKLGPVIP